MIIKTPAEPTTKLTAFLLGMREFRLCCTWADGARSEDNFYTDLDEAYDYGRECAHRITLRLFEE